jgi:hypothetical protein
MSLASAIFHLSKTDWHISKFLRAVLTQYLSEAMAMLWLAETIGMGNAAYRLWMTDINIPKFLPVDFTQSCSEAMALL